MELCDNGLCSILEGESRGGSPLWKPPWHRWLYWELCQWNCWCRSALPYAMGLGWEKGFSLSTHHVLKPNPLHHFFSTIVPTPVPIPPFPAVLSGLVGLQQPSCVWEGSSPFATHCWKGFYDSCKVVNAGRIILPALQPNRMGHLIIFCLDIQREGGTYYTLLSLNTNMFSLQRRRHWGGSQIAQSSQLPPPLVLVVPCSGQWWRSLAQPQGVTTPNLKTWTIEHFLSQGLWKNMVMHIFVLIPFISEGLLCMTYFSDRLLCRFEVGLQNINIHNQLWFGFLFPGQYRMCCGNLSQRDL